MEKEVPSLKNLCAQIVAPQLTRTQLPLLPIEDLRETLQRYMGKHRQVELFDDLKKWHANGQLRLHLHYRDGKKHGERKAWYPTGQLRYSDCWKDGKLHGNHNAWYDNGRPKRHVLYKDNNRHGEYMTWCDTGLLWHHGRYEDGVYVVNSFV